MSNYTKQDIIRMVEERRRIYPSAIYGYVRDVQKYGDYQEPVAESVRQPLHFRRFLH